MRPPTRWFVCLAFATALRCGSTNPAPPAPAAPLSAVELARSYGLALQPAPADGVPIRVVDAASGRPVGDALVVSIDEYEFTYGDVDYDDGEARTARSLLRREGCATATSGDGVARVAAPTAPRCVFVWSGGKFGRTTLEVHDRTEHVVPIAPRSLRVEVVDESGRPKAGVPIQMAKCSLEPMATATTVGTTGADGGFDIPALELERGVHRTCGRRDLVMLGALIFGGELRAADAPVLEPVRLVLPACGSIDVELQNAQGRPLGSDSKHARSLSLLVESCGRLEPHGLERKRRHWHVRSLEPPIVDGRCRLDRVELGAELTFQLEVEIRPRVFSFDHLTPIGTAEKGGEHILGPTKDGEVKHVVLRAGWFGAPEDDSESAAATKTPTVTPDESSDAATPESAAAPDLDSSFDVSVRLDVPIEPCWLRVRVDGNRDPHEHDSNPWIDVNGRATIRNVRAGTHSIKITRCSISTSLREVVLHESAEFEVAPAQHLRDPRLLDIDLRGKLQSRRLEIVDGDGKELSGLVYETRTDHPGHDEPMWFEKGRADLLSIVGDGFSTQIVANRFRPRLLAPDSRTRRIVLQRGIPIRLALAPGFEMPDAAQLEARLYVGVSEMPHFVTDQDELRSFELRPGAEPRFELAEPGQWPLVFLIGRQGANGEENVEASHLLDTTIDVLDRTEEQTFVITPDRDCWDRLVGKLRTSG